MPRIYFLITFIALTAVALAEEELIENIDVKLFENSNEFRSENSLIQLPRAASPAQGILRYVYGQHADGLKLLAQEKSSVMFPLAKRVQFEFTYPKFGIGDIITYVKIEANQSSDTGAAYVQSGDIGERTISLIVEATQTLYFGYSISIYGN